MEQESKPPDGASILEELKQALEGSARCIELARQEAARADASLREQPSEGAQVEQALLDNAKKRREQLSLLDLRFEVPPLSPPPEMPPAAPLSLDEKSVPEEPPQPPAELLPATA